MSVTVPTPPAAQGDGAAAGLPTLRAAAEQHLAHFGEFLTSYKARLRRLFEHRLDGDWQSLRRGFPPFALNEIRQHDPLSVYIPQEYGGRGGHLREGLAMLEATGYESLPLCLTFGINGALFLQPVGKYGQESTKRTVFDRFLRSKAMGGLMITEPGHGTDALSMQTSAEAHGDGVRIRGLKHWAGLTGWADYWLLTARPKTDGGLGRDIEFYVCDNNAPGQHVQVEEYYENLGLYLIPYGRNRLDVQVPAAARLEPETTGIKLMLDLLHRSRLQFPGMSTGFLRRMLDETLVHARHRFVGGKALFDYDGVKAKIAQIQAWLTASTAMCHFTSEHGGLDRDCAALGLPANAIKASVTDWMQQAAQALLQLKGAMGYRQDALAGRATTDSRPFQIFEGPNEILYEQVADAVLKQMRKVKETNLYTFLTQHDLTARAATTLRDTLSIDLDWQLPQRKLVELGQALSRLISMEMTIELGERGYRSDLIAQSLEALRLEVQHTLDAFRRRTLVPVIEDTGHDAAWLACVRS